MSQIPVVIMCGGQGTRMGNTLTKKELVDIGGRPLLWHVMRIFSAYGHNRFILALGHQADQVRRYFLEYEAMTRDVTIQLADPASGNSQPHVTFSGEYEHPPWEVTLVDTGLETERAARLAKVANYLDGERFFVAYGEAVANINLDELVQFHVRHGQKATVTGIRFRSQYGQVEADESGQITEFIEKPILPYWINGGFMLFETAVLHHILRENREDLDLERHILPQLAQQQQLMLYQHTGYWQSMKTLKDALTLKEAWQEKRPWQVW
ncbi:MAG: sugar phosphate nucleotidyltransferase [Chloroflexota bacterium]